MYGNILNHTYGSPGAVRRGLVYVSTGEKKKQKPNIAPYVNVKVLKVNDGYSNTMVYEPYFNTFGYKDVDPASSAFNNFVIYNDKDYPLTILDIADVNILKDKFNTKDFAKKPFVITQGGSDYTSDFYFNIEPITLRFWKSVNGVKTYTDSYTKDFIVFYQKRNHTYKNKSYSLKYNDWLIGSQWLADSTEFDCTIKSSTLMMKEQGQDDLHEIISHDYYKKLKYDRHATNASQTGFVETLNFYFNNQILESGKHYLIYTPTHAAAVAPRYYMPTSFDQWYVDIINGHGGGTTPTIDVITPSDIAYTSSTVETVHCDLDSANFYYSDINGTIFTSRGTIIANADAQTNNVHIYVEK